MDRCFRKILIAADGSEHVKKAIAHAIELAKLYGAELHAIYVIDLKTEYSRSLRTDRSGGGLRRILNQGLPDMYKKEGEAAIQYIEDSARKEGLSIQKWVMAGHPAEQILKLSEDQLFDLIVMGTLGRSGIEKFLVGSVAEKVIRNSRIPVLTVRK